MIGKTLGHHRVIEQIGTDSIGVATLSGILPELFVCSGLCGFDNDPQVAARLRQTIRSAGMGNDGS